MGHPSNEVMPLFAKDLGFPDYVRSKNNMCDACYCAKHTRMQFHVSDNKANDLFEVVHCDIWEPYRTPSSCGASYFLTLVDDASRGVWLYLMKEKSEVDTLLKEFVSMAQTQFDKQVKVV